MTDDGAAKVRVRPRYRGGILAALTLALGVCAVSINCPAAEPSGQMPARPLGTLLAAYSEHILSESAMAGQKGAGLSPPSIVTNEANSSAKVMLWDEMKTAPLLNPAQDGVVTGGVSGK